MNTAPQAHNPEGMTKSDVTVEAWREYVFSDGFVYRVADPCILYVKRKPEGDSHRVVDREGVIHYVPTGWRILRWHNKAGAPEVAF